jgi:hypothetical protein
MRDRKHRVLRHHVLTEVSIQRARPRMTSPRQAKYILAMPFLPINLITGHVPSTRLTKNTERTTSTENRATSQAETDQVSRN